MALDSQGNYYADLPDEKPGQGTPSGGSSSGANPDLSYTSNPNDENLIPANPLLECVAYSKDGSGSFFGWDVEHQRWV